MAAPPRVVQRSTVEHAGLSRSDAARNRAAMLAERLAGGTGRLALRRDDLIFVKMGEGAAEAGAEGSARQTAPAVMPAAAASAAAAAAAAAEPRRLIAVQVGSRWCLPDDRWAIAQILEVEEEQLMVHWWGDNEFGGRNCPYGSYVGLVATNENGQEIPWSDPCPRKAVMGKLTLAGHFSTPDARGRRKLLPDLLKSLPVLYPEIGFTYMRAVDREAILAAARGVPKRRPAPAASAIGKAKAAGGGSGGGDGGSSRGGGSSSTGRSLRATAQASAKTWQKACKTRRSRSLDSEDDDESSSD